MLKKLITYEDLDGQEVTEEFCFNLSKADLIEIELNADGGMETYLKRIVESNNNREIYNEFKRIILLAYGERSLNGKTFIKSQELRDSFEGSEAYSSLIVELLGDENAAATFVAGIIPKNLDPIGPSNPTRDAPTEKNGPMMGGDPLAEETEPERRVLTPLEIENMPAVELKTGIASGKYVIG